MYVSDILKVKGGEVVSITATETIYAALSLLATNKIGAVLVTDPQGGIAGIMSERDLVRAMHKYGKDLFDKHVGDLMTSNVVTCSPKDPVAAIMGMMTSQRFRHVPVVEDGKLAGMISIGDVVKSRIEEAQFEVDALRRYIAL
ncbi:MAG TPA: CBS domain-containing protein [Rhodospirillales bacterium]|nr:CBS domain-containing protein [Rhodospirillales bacterium]